jgi:hypothetical protein
VIVDNNVATGATLSNVVRALQAGRPAQLGFFCDYVLTDLAGLDADAIRHQGTCQLAPLLVGPFPAPAHRLVEARQLKIDLARAARVRRAALGAPSEGGRT